MEERMNMVKFMEEMVEKMKKQQPTLSKENMNEKLILSQYSYSQGEIDATNMWIDMLKSKGLHKERR